MNKKMIAIGIGILIPIPLLILPYTKDLFTTPFELKDWYNLGLLVSFSPALMWFVERGTEVWMDRVDTVDKTKRKSIASNVALFIALLLSLAGYKPLSIMFGYTSIFAVYVDTLAGTLLLTSGSKGIHNLTNIFNRSTSRVEKSYTKLKENEQAT